ncbi:MAG: lysophospholipid acyltransferase family protein [Bacilli bacterium]|nr:lysophospholipid acyltransferase family protein [Bacilli bacterium]
MLKQILKGSAIGIFKILYGLEIIGKENIPATGPVILAGKHTFALDPIFLMAMTKRDISFMAKKELWDHKCLKLLLEYYKAISVDREKNDIGAVKKAISVLKNNNVLGIFPEGKRNGLENGDVIKQGAANFAISYKAPVVPFNIKGNFKIFNKLSIIVGNPIYLDKNNSVVDGTKLIMDSIVNLDVPPKVKKLALKKEAF